MGGVAVVGLFLVVQASSDSDPRPAAAAPRTTTTTAPAAPEPAPAPAAEPEPAVVAAAVTPPAPPPVAKKPAPPPAPRTPVTRKPVPPAPPATDAKSVPVRIRIGAIAVSAPIDPLGLNRNGTMQVPKNFQRAGYYTGRPVPGAIGPAIIVAHVSSRAGPAVFFRLKELTPGDEVTVTRADGAEVVFVVDRVEQHPKNAFPTEAVYGPTPDATLRLITCGGSFDQATRHHRDNIVAFAHLKV
jgi:hypothetical protein